MYVRHGALSELCRLEPMAYNRRPLGAALPGARLEEVVGRIRRPTQFGGPAHHRGNHDTNFPTDTLQATGR